MRRRGTAQFAAIQSAAPTFGVELTPIGVRDPGEIERGLTNFAAKSDAGLIVTASAFTAVHRDLITGLAARCPPSIRFDISCGIDHADE